MFLAPAHRDPYHQVHHCCNNTESDQQIQNSLVPRRQRWLMRCCYICSSSHVKFVGRDIYLAMFFGTDVEVYEIIFHFHDSAVPCLVKAFCNCDYNSKWCKRLRSTGSRHIETHCSHTLSVLMSRMVLTMTRLTILRARMRLEVVEVEELNFHCSGSY